MPRASCPGRESLEALRAGRLEGVALEEAAAHLDSCPVCQADARRLEGAAEPALPGLARGSADTDRNLLFAVLALQADLIDRDRFVQACTLWASRKDRPIAALLVEQGWLSAED